MQVFKAYFKIIRKRLPIILLYVVLFVVISLIITTSMMSAGTAKFSATKADLALFNGDAGSKISQGLADYLGNASNVVHIDDDRQSIEDALFYGNIDYALRIPAGFSKGFLAGSDGAKLEKTAASGTITGVYVDFLVERYLNIAELYVRNAPGMSEAEITANVAKDLENRADVNLKTYGNTADTNYLSYYFQYLAYSIMAVMILGVTSFMMAFNDMDIANRNLCSPTRPLSMNLQIMLGNVTFALVTWAAMCVMVFAAYGKAPGDAGTVLLCANALAMTIASLGMGFLAGKFVRNGGVQSAVANVVSLGISFISGIFVEQDLLGETVLNIAKFTPGYWYVKAVNDIRGMSAFDFQSIEPVLLGMLVQLGFAAMFFLVAFAASKQIRLSREA